MTKSSTSCILAYSTLLILVSYFFYDFRARRLSYEFMENFIEAEAVRIQQGNLLSSLSEYERVIRSSGYLKGIGLVESNKGFCRTLVRYGKINSLSDKCADAKNDEIILQWAGFLKYFASYQLPNRPELAVVIVFAPSTLTAMFILNVGIIFALSLFFIFYIRRLQISQNTQKLRLVDSTINALLAEEKTPDLIHSTNPAWQELAKTIVKLRDDYKQKTKSEAIALATAHICHDLRGPVNVFQEIVDKDHIQSGLSNTAQSALFRINSMIEAFRNKEQDLLVKQHDGFLNLQTLADEIGLGKDVKILVSGDPEQKLYADIAKLERISINLMKNAIEAGATALSVDMSEGENDALHLTFTDNGPGIPPSLVKTAFERGVTGGKKGGTGLGLAYCRDVARGHGGDISYSREEGRSIFKIDIPNGIRHGEIFVHCPEEREPEPAPIDPSKPPRKRQIYLHVPETALREKILAHFADSETRITIDPKQKDESLTVATTTYDQYNKHVIELEYIEPDEPIEVIASKMTARLARTEQIATADGIAVN